MAFVCYVLLKEANIYINFICFNRNVDHPLITVVTFIPRKQSIKPRFFHKNIVFLEKVFDMDLLLGLSSLFRQYNRAFWKNCYFCCTVWCKKKPKKPNFQNDQKSQENRTNMDISLLFLAKPLDKHGIKVCTISFERLEASPWTFTVPVQLSAFHYLTAS